MWAERGQAPFSTFKALMSSHKSTSLIWEWQKTTQFPHQEHLYMDSTNSTPLIFLMTFLGAS